jgi:hypothetical protein
MTNESIEAVTLAAIALELGTTVDDLERQVGADVFRDAAGFRSVTRFKASLLIAEHGRRNAEAERLAAENQERTRQAIDRARARTAKTFQQFGLTTTTIDLGPGDVLPVQAMTAAADLDFDGATRTPRLSRIDWLSGKGDTGGELGPNPAPRRKKGGAK